MRKSWHWPDMSRSCPSSSPQCEAMLSYSTLICRWPVLKSYQCELELFMHSWSVFVTDGVFSVLEGACIRFIGEYFIVKTCAIIFLLVFVSVPLMLMKTNFSLQFTVHHQEKSRQHLQGGPLGEELKHEETLLPQLPFLDSSCSPAWA